MDGRREDRALVDATRPFARESRPRSWWNLASSLLPLAAALAGAFVMPPWPLRLALSVLAGLLVVRTFTIYHDFLHGAILRRSPLAKALMHGFGVLALTPPRVWRHTHNYHHAHTAKIVGSHVGSFPMLTTDIWKRLPRRDRIRYALARHPLTIALGYVTVFIWGMCIAPFVRNPRKHWDSAAALVLHLTLSAGIVVTAGVDAWVSGLLLPLVVACALGSYLFYAQHNFERVHVQPRHRWRYARAALESSSYMPMGPVMRWFTGNIGYHHVHHLNPTIPFYRLPEAMAAIPELQHPGVTTLRPRDVVASLRLKLWDPEQERMIGWPA